MKDALKIIIAKSPEAGTEAMQCLRAIDANSPVLQHRYNRTVEIALSDQGARFTPGERVLIAEHVNTVGESVRDMDIRVRVNASEKAAVQEMAQAEDMTVSNFIRDRIGI